MKSQYEQRGLEDAIKKYQLFFSSCFHEILDVNCHPLYKKRDINIKILVGKIVNCLKYENVSISDNQVKNLVNEFLYYCKIDPVFKRYDRDSRILVKKVQEINNQKESLKSKKELLSLFEILESELNRSYIKTLQGLLNSFLALKFFNRDNLNYSKKIYNFENLIYIFISELKIKYTEKYLNYIFREKFYRNCDFSSSYNYLFSLLLADKYSFSCYIKFNILCPDYIQNMLGEHNIDNVLSPIYSFLSKKEDVELIFRKMDEKHIESGKNFLESNGYFVKIDLDGYDFYKVAYNAREELIRKLDVLLYRNNFLLTDISNEVLVQDKRKEENVFLVKTKRDINFNLDITRKNISVTLFNLLKSEDVEKDTLLKIEDSLKYYRFYLYENNPDSALLNLWIALESLFSSGGKEGNFDLIKSIIPTAASLYYLREMFDELQLHILNKIKQESAKGIKFGIYSNLKNYVENNNIYQKRTSNGSREVRSFNNVGLLRILSDVNKKNNFINQIDNSYYFHKYSVLSDKVALENGSFNRLSNFLNLNYTAAQWEICEIYRMRNSIVHGGKGSNLTTEVIYFLEYYYILLLDDILYKLGASDFKNVISIEEYFNRLKRTYDNYNNLINKKIDNNEYKFFVLPYFVL